MNLKTNERRTFRNCTVAASELGFVNGTVSAVATGSRASTGGWWFSYSADASPPKLYAGTLVALARSKAVVATSEGTGERREYPSAKVAAADLGMSRAAISKALGRKRPTGGWRFAFRAPAKPK